MERETILAKKIEAIIGLTMLLPVVIGIIHFIYSLLDGGFTFWQGRYGVWAVHYGSKVEGAAMSPTPIFYGLMAIAAVLILKDSLKYLFIKLPPKN